MLIIGRLLYSTQQWLSIVTVMCSRFRARHLAFDSPARRYLTTAIFPVYILHQTVIIICAHTLKPAHCIPW